VPLQNLRTDESGWQSLSVPLRAIAGLRETNGQIAKIGFFGDTTGVFYIGEIRTLSESRTRFKATWPSRTPSARCSPRAVRSG
jgi:hypothetical protein